MKTTQECVFCKIINNEIPGKIFKVDKQWVTLLPLEQISDGHILLVPKSHSKDIFDLDIAALNTLGNALELVSRQQKMKYNADGVNILSANGEAAQQSIYHLHFHIVPRFNNDKLDLWFQMDHRPQK